MSLNLLYFIILVSIYSPITDGYIYVYDILIEPVLLKYESTIGRSLELAQNELDHKLNKIKKVAVEKVLE